VEVNRTPETLPCLLISDAENIEISDICWNAHLKTLYEKASLIFAVLAEKEYVNENYDVSLKHMRSIVLPEDVGNTLRCKKRQINQLSTTSRGKQLFYNGARLMQHREA